MSTTLETLQAINTLLETVNPLAAAAISLGSVIVAEIKDSGVVIVDFTTEIARFDANIAKGLAVDDAWRAAHGLPPAHP